MVGEIKVGKIKEPQSGTITFGLRRQSDLRPHERNFNKFLQASRAPVAFARETEDSGRRTHGGYRGMCSAPVDPGGEVRSCCVGCILGTPEISPFVFIVAASRYMGFLTQ